MNIFNMSNNTDLHWVEELLGVDSWDNLGSGYFAKCFETNRGTALKLTVDKMYMEYVELVKDLDNPMFPKIINNFGCIGTIGKQNLELYAVEMPLYGDMYSYINKRKGVDYDSVSNDADSFKGDLCNGGMDNVISRAMKYGGEDSLTNLCMSLGVDYFEMLDAFHIIDKHFKGKVGFWFDTHLGNFMYDKKGQVIITDPVAYSGAGNGLSVGYSRLPLNEVYGKLDMSKIEELSCILHSEKAVSMFAKFKMSVHEDKPSNINFRHLSLGRQTYDKKVDVFLGKEVLTKHNTYQSVKTRNGKKARYSFDLGVKCNGSSVYIQFVWL